MRATSEKTEKFISARRAAGMRRQIAFWHKTTMICAAIILVMGITLAAAILGFKHQVKCLNEQVDTMENTLLATESWYNWVNGVDASPSTYNHDDEISRVSAAIDDFDFSELGIQAESTESETLAEEAESIELPVSDEPIQTAVEEHVEAYEVSATSIQYSSVPLEPELIAHVVKLAEDNGFAPAILFGMAKKESTYNATATHTNDNGTVDNGMWQINSSNFASLARAFGMTQEELEGKILDPYFNAECAVWMLKDMKRNHPDNYNTLLMCYNMGGGNAKVLWERGIYSSNYSRTVIRYASELGWSDPGHL